MAEIEIVSDLDELPRLAEFVEEFAEASDLSPEAGMRLNLALEELVTNVIQHGYAGAMGKIELQLERQGDRVDATLSDTAPAYDPFTADEPDLSASVEDRKVGGLGVHLVRTVATSFGYQRQGDRNQVSLSLPA